MSKLPSSLLRSVSSSSIIGMNISAVSIFLALNCASNCFMKSNRDWLPSIPPWKATIDSASTGLNELKLLISAEIASLSTLSSVSIKPPHAIGLQTVPTSLLRSDWWFSMTIVLSSNTPPMVGILSLFSSVSGSKCFFSSSSSSLIEAASFSSPLTMASEINCPNSFGRIGAASEVTLGVSDSVPSEFLTELFFFFLDSFAFEAENNSCTVAKSNCFRISRFPYL